MSEWQPIETAPKTRVRSFDGYIYGPLILAYPVNGKVDTVEWWQSKQRPEACNFLDGGGNAAHPTHWMPLPDPPSEQFYQAGNQALPSQPKEEGKEDLVLRDSNDSLTVAGM